MVATEMPEFTLHHGDALDLLRGLPDASVDAVITDPPYSSGGAFRGDRMESTSVKYNGWSQGENGSKEPEAEYPEFTGDTRDQRGYLHWCAIWLGECRRIAKPGAILMMFTDWRQLPTTTDAVQAGGWIWRGLLVWDKGVGRPMKGRFRNHVEYVVWGSNGPMPDADENPVYPSTIFRHTPPTSHTRLHRTEKPARLLIELMAVVKPGGVVLDPVRGIRVNRRSVCGNGPRVHRHGIVPRVFQLRKAANRLGNRTVKTVRSMTPRLSLILILLTSCAPTPQTAREGTPLVPLSTQAVNVAPAGLRSIATPSGLQSALTAASKAGRASSPVIINGTITLTKPIDVYGYAKIIAGPNGGKLTSPSTQPLIHFRSQYGHGFTSDVLIDGVDLEAPNAETLWDWPKATHAGNAANYIFRNGQYTAKRSHLNCEAPGDGRAYHFKFENIDCYGTGAMMTGRPVIGVADRCRQVNAALSVPFAIDVHDCELSVENCWIQPVGSGVLRIAGEFSQVFWGSYSEPINFTPPGPQVMVDGVGCVLTVTKALYFIMPAQRVVAANGGQVIFTGLPDCQNANGGHPDWTQPLATYVDHLKACFTVSGAGSQVAWPAGRVDARGVWAAAATQPVMAEQAQN
jgi:site-specific DNA-methyltransferase (adenine-specific)